MKTLNKIFFCVFFLSTLLRADAQSPATNPHLWLDGWEAGLNLGSVLFWGDMSDEVDFAASKFARRDENKFSLGGYLSKDLGPSGLTLNLMRGRFSGGRSVWSDEQAANLGFVGDFVHYDLQLTLDPIRLIAGHNPHRFFSFKGHGGVGFVHYRSIKRNTITNEVVETVGYNDDGTQKTSMGNSLIIPFGTTLRFRLNHRLTLSAATTWTYAFSDDLDAHIGTGSDVNDMYSFTSLGLAYRFSLPDPAPHPAWDYEPDRKPEPIIAGDDQRAGTGGDIGGRHIRPHPWRDQWEASISAGPVFFWGDMSDRVDFPLEKLTKKDESKFGYSGRLSKYAGAAGLHLNVTGGKFSGVRNFWSNNVPANMGFSGSFIHYDVQVALDPIRLFAGYNPDRIFTFEGHGGFGNVHYRSIKRNTISNDVLQVVGYDDTGNKKTSMGSSLIIPFGTTLKFRLSRSLALNTGVTWVYAFSDELDAHVGTGSEVNDMYTLTSLGLTYRFSLPKRDPVKPVILPEPEEIPDPIIAVTPAAPDVVEPSTGVVINMPSEVEVGEEFDINVRIQTKDIPEMARLQLTFPYGFSIIPPEQDAGEYRFRDMIMSMNWNPYPQTRVLEFNFRAIALDVPPGDINIPGLLIYQVEKEDKIYQFRKGLSVKAAPVIAVEETEEEVVVEIEVYEEETVDTVKPDRVPEVTIETKTAQPLEGIEYRVQLRAIYGGKESANRVQRELNLDIAVFENYHQGYYKYSAGQFRSYEEANALKNELRSDRSVPDAFVVAFHNGERLNSLADVASVATAATTPQPSPAGISYKIQIAALAGSSTTPPSYFAGLYNITEPISVDVHNGLRKFTVGVFTDRNEAQNQLQIIRRNVADAFVVRYTDGVR